jgi:hypothetical protein
MCHGKHSHPAGAGQASKKKSFELRVGPNNKFHALHEKDLASNI